MTDEEFETRNKINNEVLRILKLLESHGWLPEHFDDDRCEVCNDILLPLSNAAWIESDWT